MTIAEIINLVDHGVGSVLGTGTKGSKPFLKKVSCLWLIPQGFVFDPARELTYDYAQELQAQGKIIVLKGIRAFTDNTPDDTIDELEDGTKSVARLGLYEFVMNFINGLHFHAALHSLSSFGNYDVVMWDREGNGLGTVSTNGSLKGFTAGMVQASKLTWPTDAASQREGLGLQLLDRSELDQDYAFLQREKVGWNPNRMDGINEVILSFPSAPVAAATTITVEAVTAQDRQPFTGADFADFLLKKNGTTTNPTAGDDSAEAGTYVLTVSALSTNDALAIELYDNVNNNSVIKIDTDQYKSNTATATVV